MQMESIKSHELTLGVLAAGDPSKPSLVLLHGWPQSKEVYDQVIDELASDYYVLAFDLPGGGDSRGVPKSADKKVLADILLGVAEGAGARSIVIAGFDVGGMIAYAAARDYGHRILGAVVVNTVLPGIDPWSKVLEDPHIWHFAFHAIPELPELLIAGHQRAYFDFFVNARAGHKESISERHRAIFSRAYQRYEALQAGFDWYRAMKADAKRNSRRKEFRTPMLYLRGDADGRSPKDFLPGLKDAGALHVEGGVLHGSGEFAPLEAPHEFAKAVVSFARACAKL